MLKDILGDSFSILEKFAPTLASVIGSPVAGKAAMISLNLLANAFGVPVNNLNSALAMNPDSADRLSKLEDMFSEWFRDDQGKIRDPQSIEVNIKINF